MVGTKEETIEPKQDYHLPKTTRGREKGVRTVQCSALTVLVEQQDQVFPVEGVDGEKQSRTLPRPEAQRDVLSSQRHVGVDERCPGAAVPAQNVEFLESVGDGRGGPEAGRDL